MKGFKGGMHQMMRQVAQMQNKMKKIQEELANQEFEGVAGGGGVTVKVNGNNELTSVLIQKDVFEAGDPEILQDLFLVAANEALKAAKEASEREMSKVTGGMSLPGLF
ncbi:MAG: YbaB/EbfC family nucleoid-associated protein [Bdellovibrio sp.]|nr:MAG: YbaB/EbfC family nucleoid-associated protein [Bdellovibrio sp.]